MFRVGVECRSRLLVSAVRRLHSTSTSTNSSRPSPSTFFASSFSWSPQSTPEIVGQFDASPSMSKRRSRTNVTHPSSISLYLQLSKARLTSLVVLTAMSGVALSPLPASVPCLLATAAGTVLCAASANALNQMQEVAFDGLMPRTRTRPLVRGAMTPAHAARFAAVTGVAGPALLYAVVNPTTAILGAANIWLYAAVYTPLKRVSVANTWVGALVGALPPLMGWAATGAPIVPEAPTLTDLAYVAAPLTLAIFHFAWQFPHFNPLAHLTREAYAQAGYAMIPVVRGLQSNAAVSLRHALYLLPICSALAPLSGLTTWTFALSSIPPNIAFIRAAWSFYRSKADQDARALFRHSLWYLPLVLALMMIHKPDVDWLSWLQGGTASPDSSTDSRAD